MAARRPRHSEHGAALLIFLILLVTAALTYVVSSLTPEALEARRARKTQEALGQAREALIGYALRYREDQIGDGQYDRVYGYLPLPDLGTSRNSNVSCTQEGCDAANFTGNALNTTVIGRLPWRTLGLTPLTDGAGECLWYIVSGSHQRQQRTTPMNWDSLGQLDIVVANGSTALASLLATAHDRPVAVIVAPGTPLPGQDRSDSSTDSVSHCRGNYNAANYLDPTNASALGGITNYFAGTTNNASAVTGDTNPANDPDTPKSLSIQGKVFAAGGSFAPTLCQDGNCTLLANDLGLTLSNDTLFGAIRKNANFRNDINTLLERIVGCLRDEIAAGSTPANGKIAGADGNSCYGSGTDPLGYYPHYRDMIFVAAPGSANVSMDGATQPACTGALVFAGQRRSGQLRSTAAERSSYANYLEGSNLTSFMASGTSFAGAGLLQATPGQAANQDIVRCIPTGASLTSVQSTRLTEQGVGQLTGYDASTRTLTLGRLYVESDLGYTAQALFGCAWQPEARALLGGMRSYFKFNIQNTGNPGEGFVFAMIDGDANSTAVCGGARQHIGYSGNNGYTPSITYPKIGIEVDARRNYREDTTFPIFNDPLGFDPAYISAFPDSISYLNNGRADPAYTGGHAAIVYWGGEAAISTGIACGFGCVEPQYCGAGNICYLNPEEDDNVHGRTAVATGSRPPPRNPDAPTDPIATPPAGIYKLDPSLSQVPFDKDIHVRVELIPAPTRSVQLVATSNRALSGLAAIDGVVPVAGDRILLTAQTDSRQNGVWRAASGTWSRDAAESSYSLMPYGTLWSVSAGTEYRGTVWRLSNPDGYVLGDDNLTISRTPPYHAAANSHPVRVVATSAIALSSLPTIDGVALLSGDRVLVTAQSTPAENGVYIASAGAWTRASTENESAELAPGAHWIVRQGSSKAWTLWRAAHDINPSVGVSDIEIVPATAPWSAVATAPVTLSGLQTVGGRTLAAGEWVLVTAQAAAGENGLYHVHNGSWARIPMFQKPWQVQAWILAYSATDANRIAKMSLISRPLASLDANYPPHLSDTLTIYSPPVAACTGQAECPSGQWCGLDNICYRPGFRTVRLGFTNAQSTQDQIIYISDFASTWLP